MNRAMRGYGLLEVLLALLTVTTGLLGLSATMLVTQRTQQAAIVRTQVAWLAADLVERLRLNPAAAAQGAYNGHYPSMTDAHTCENVGCDPGELARHDRRRWSALLRTHLPATARALLACDHGGLAADTGNITCALDMAWQTPGVEPSLTRMTWSFRP
jgi:type IV pilus assembly protein PilV